MSSEILDVSVELGWHRGPYRWPPSDWNTFFGYLLPYLYQQFRSRGLGAEAADEASQRVCVRLYQGHEGNDCFSDPRRLRMFIAASVSATCREMRSIALANPLPPGFAAVQPPGGDDEDRLDWLLSLVPDEETRNLLRLKYREGMTFAAIAARTGRPLSSVASRVAKALETLRERVQGDELRQ